MKKLVTITIALSLQSSVLAENLYDISDRTLGTFNPKIQEQESEDTQIKPHPPTLRHKRLPKRKLPQKYEKQKQEKTIFDEYEAKGKKEGFIETTTKQSS